MADLLAADELEEAGQIVMGADFVRDEWGRVGFDLATDAWVVADGPGAIVGYVQAKFGEPAGVECWGVVHPGHRGRGIGSSLGAALLGRSFATFAGRGIWRVILNVDAENPTGATALYEHAGMRVISRWDVWEHSLANPHGS